MKLNSNGIYINLISIKINRVNALFHKKMNKRNILGQAQFGINLFKLCLKITKKKDRLANGDRIMARVYPDLDECRKAFEALVKSSIDWS